MPIHSTGTSIVVTMGPGEQDGSSVVVEAGASARGRHPSVAALRARTDQGRTWGDMNSCHAPHATTCNLLIGCVILEWPDATAPLSISARLPPITAYSQSESIQYRAEASEGAGCTVRSRRCDSAGATSVGPLVRKPFWTVDARAHVWQPRAPPLPFHMRSVRRIAWFQSRWNSGDLRSAAIDK